MGCSNCGNKSVSTTKTTTGIKKQITTKSSTVNQTAGGLKFVRN